MKRVSIFLALILLLIPVFAHSAAPVTATQTPIRYGDLYMKQQASTPASPASGYNRMYFKSDGKLYGVNSSGVEVAIGLDVSTLSASQFLMTDTNKALVSKTASEMLTALGISGPLLYKGATDCSTNPNYPSAAAAGESYIVSVDGKIGGASGPNVTTGDMFISKTVNAGGTQAAVGSSWNIVQANIDLSNIIISGGTIANTSLDKLVIRRLANGAITAHTLVKGVAGGQIGPVVSDTEGILGVAENSATNPGDTVNVTVLGPTTVLCEGTITDLHYLIAGTSDPTKVKDSGQTSLGMISISSRVIAKAVGADSAGSVSVNVIGSYRFGALVDSLGTVTSGRLSPLQVKGPAVITSFAGTISRSGTTLTFSQASDAVLAGYAATDPVLGTTVVHPTGPVTMEILAWLSNVTATVDLSGTLAAQTPTSVQEPVAFMANSAGTLAWALLANGTMYSDSVLIGATTKPFADQKLQVVGTNAAMSVTANLPISAGNGLAFSVSATGEGYQRTSFYTSGNIGFGPGNATRDVFIGRTSSNTIGITGAYDGTGTGNFYVSGHVGIGTTTFGTSAAKVLGLGLATSPTTTPSGVTQIYSSPLSGAGQAALGIFQEYAPYAAPAAVSTTCIPMNVNGVHYCVMASTAL